MVHHHPTFPEHISLESSLGFWSQLTRTDRQYRKLEEFYEPGSSQESLDQFLFFFLCFYSLRDWLKAHTPEAHAMWEKRFRGLLAWRFCRDVSNRFKHLTVSQPSLDVPFTMLREYAGGGRERMSFIHESNVLPLMEMARLLKLEMVEFIREADSHLPPRARGI